MTQGPDASNPSVLETRARACLQAGDIRSARELYRQLCLSRQDDPQAWHMLGAVNGMLGLYADAEQCCRRTLSLQPTAAGAYANLANVLAAQDKHGEARAAYVQALQLDPLDAQTHNNFANLLARLGETEAAESHYRRAIAIADRYAAAHNNLGTLLLRQGRGDEAIACFETAIRCNSNYAEAHLNLGSTLLQRNDAQGAIACFNQALRLRPDLTDAHKGLATALLSLGRAAEAIDHWRRVVLLVPGDVGARFGLATALREAGNSSEALSACQEILRHDPDHHEALMLAATLHQESGRMEEALNAARRAAERRPDDIAAQMKVGEIAYILGKLDIAITALRRATALAPTDARAFSNLGLALQQAGDWDQAGRCYRRAIELDPLFAGPHHNLGFLCAAENRFQEAISHYREAMALSPGNPDTAAGIAMALERLGDFGAAYEEIWPLLESGSDNPHVAVAFATLARRLGRENEAIVCVENALRSPTKTHQQRVELHFAAAALYDRLDRHDEAFEHYRAGNSLQPHGFDAQLHTRHINALIASFDTAFMASAPRASNRSELPIFIVGMPRSGTSLVEQILASHPSVHGAGELEKIPAYATSLPTRCNVAQAFPQCMKQVTAHTLDEIADEHLAWLAAHADGAVRVSDKLPGNFLFLGLIELLFPAARIIHCIRDPLDTCLSCYFQNFAKNNLNFSRNLVHLGAYYNDYRRLMNHWRKVIRLPVLEIRYEELVMNPDTIVHSLIAFCGLDWDDRCLRFHETKRLVTTASYGQVREPLHARSVGRWRKYERHLAPLIAALGKNGEE